MIPKICHLYWDCTPMSFLNTLTVLSFHKYNPDWKIIIYMCPDRGKNIYSKDYTGRDYFYQLRYLDYVEFQDVDLSEMNIHKDIPSHQISTMWRTQILHKHGGVYSDFDVIWLKPMPHLMDVEGIGNSKDFQSIVCFYELTHGFTNGSIMVAEASSDYIKFLIDSQLNVSPPYEHQSFGTTLYNRLHPTLDDVHFDRIFAIPYLTFYPYSTYNMGQLFIETDLSPLDNPNVMAIHWFYANPISTIFVNRDNYDIDCSMTRILKREGYLMI